jgi:hypothetical protein
MEAAVLPPRVGLGFDTLKATLAAPVRKVGAALEIEEERDLVRAMYREFRKTGKVRDTLPEDDRMVRRLHAIEVLRAPLASIDALWPRETGTAHGAGRPARVTKKPKPERAAANLSPGRNAARRTLGRDPGRTQGKARCRSNARHVAGHVIAERTRQVGSQARTAAAAQEQPKPTPPRAVSAAPRRWSLKTRPNVRLSHEVARRACPLDRPQDRQAA